MKDANQAQTKAYMVFQKHIQMIEDKAQSMGQASNSAALRSILDEWQQNRENAQESVAQSVAALARQ